MKALILVSHNTDLEDVSTPSTVVAVVSTAAASITITAFASFLLHIIVIYKCIYKKSKAKPKSLANIQDENNYYDNNEIGAEYESTEEYYENAKEVQCKI
jgi:hypothetical protein